MLSSRDGRLDVDLIASPGEYTINGYQFQGMLYNGAYIPPVWRIRLGDILTVTVHNRLSKPTELALPRARRLATWKWGSTSLLNMLSPERPSRIKSRSQKSTLGSSGFIHTCTGMWFVAYQRRNLVKNFSRSHNRGAALQVLRGRSEIARSH